MQHLRPRKTFTLAEAESRRFFWNATLATQKNLRLSASARVFQNQQGRRQAGRSFGSRPLPASVDRALSRPFQPVCAQVASFSLTSSSRSSRLRFRSNNQKKPALLPRVFQI